MRREPVLHGERATLEALRRLDDEWSVFYSLSFLDRGSFDRQRELDFLALHPLRGAVFIEVKGGRVEFDKGRVSQWLDAGWTQIDPAEQLNGARRVALDFMKSIHGGFIPGRNLYVFPSTYRPPSGLSQELSTASVFSDQLQDLAAAIELLTRDTNQLVDQVSLSSLLESCLTHDVNLSSPVHQSDPRDRPSLKAIESGFGHGFSTLTEMRSALLAHRSDLQELWDGVASAKTELENLEGRSSHREHDLLSTLLRQTENILASESVEVGVFGQVKRGKSTLVNALVNREVSAVGMLPKTAVPVVVEWAPEESGFVQYADGSSAVVPIEAAIEATTQSERKRRESEGLPLVDRVTVRMPLEWLPRGVRLVDTPGLSDPSLIDEYESFAIAELERVAAGILVISYPPGPELHETQLLKRLAEFGLAKLFFVVNMWSDVWKDASARREVTDYVAELIKSASNAGADISKEDIRVFGANLGAARKVQMDGKPKKIADTGIRDIRDAVEEFLTSGALNRIGVSASRRLLEASDVIEKTLLNRKKAIEVPATVQQMRTDLAESIRQSETSVDRIMEGVHLRCSKLQEELIVIATEPYVWARSVLETTRKRATLRDLQTRMSIRASTSAAQLASTVSKSATQIVADARTSLARDLGVTNWEYSPRVDTDSLFLADFSEPLVAEETGPSDYSVEARGVGALMGAMLGGGTGIALAATGPVGLLVGGLLGYLFGDTFGKLTQTAGNSDEASTQEIEKLKAAIDEADRKSRASVSKSMEGFQVSIKSALEDQKRSLLASGRKELATVEALLADERGKQSALAEIEAGLKKLAALVG